MRRWTLLLDPFTDRELRTRSRAHGVSMAAYARAAITGRRPGGMPGQPADAADHWWDHLSPSRRAQVHSWVASASRGSSTPDPSQLTIEEALHEHGNG